MHDTLRFAWKQCQMWNPKLINLLFGHTVPPGTHHRCTIFSMMSPTGPTAQRRYQPVCQNAYLFVKRLINGKDSICSYSIFKDFHDGQKRYNSYSAHHYLVQIQANPKDRRLTHWCPKSCDFYRIHRCLSALCPTVLLIVANLAICLLHWRFRNNKRWPPLGN